MVIQAVVDRRQPVAGAGGLVLPTDRVRGLENRVGLLLVIGMPDAHGNIVPKQALRLTVADELNPDADDILDRFESMVSTAVAVAKAEWATVRAKKEQQNDDG